MTDGLAGRRMADERCNAGRSTAPSRPDPRLVSERGNDPMTWLSTLFWISAACASYTYVGYPLLVALAARLWPARSKRGLVSDNLPVTVVLSVHNEETRIGGRIRELVQLVAGRSAGGEVIVVSDGSTDRTVAEAHASASEAESAACGRVAVRVIVQEPRLGKAMALNRAHGVACHPLLVFADARQSWAPDAIDRLVAAFADPSVGAVSGDLVVESAPGVMAGVGLYWRFEKWLRRTESRFDSMVSVTGSISAVRRELFETLPAGTILDDVYWPLAVAMRGHRVIHEERARAFDRLPEKARDEFRRKVRTLAGGYQLMTPHARRGCCPGATGSGGSSSRTGRCGWWFLGRCSSSWVRVR